MKCMPSVTSSLERPIGQSPKAEAVQEFQAARKPKEDAKDAEEYNALYKSIDEREREWQNIEDLYNPRDHPYADDEQSGAQVPL